MQLVETIQNKIYNLRGERVLTDKDLAFLYETATKRLVEAVKRNIKRFPPGFMFRLTKTGVAEIKEMSNEPGSTNSLRSQIASSNRGGNWYLPYAFTEQGVAMLSGVLSSEKAISMNIAIMRAFVNIRRIVIHQNDLHFSTKRNKKPHWWP